MSVRILNGDCRDVLKTLPDESVNCCVTSPPYFGLRDYGVEGQIGLEESPDAFVAELVAVFRDVRRVLRADGTLWLNLGDSYCANGGIASQGLRGQMAGRSVCGARDGVQRNKPSAELKPKDLIGIPWRVAFALQSDGWWLRQDIIWHKPNPMPESTEDRCTKSHEYVFLLTKSPRYFFDNKAIQEPAEKPEGPRQKTQKYGAAYIETGDGRLRTKANLVNIGASDVRNKRSVWTIATQPYSEAHFATFPPTLIEPCIKAGCPAGGTVLDPFGGAGTTGLVADRLGRDALLIELNPAYAAMARNRLERDAGMFAAVAAE